MHPHQRILPTLSPLLPLLVLAFAGSMLLFSVTTRVEARAQNGTLMIADFDSGRIESKSGLALMSYADEQFGGTSEAQVSLVHPGANSAGGALRIAFRITDDFVNPFAGSWVIVGREGLATDLSTYRGVRFYARSSDGGAFEAGIVRFSGRLRRYLCSFETRPEWTLVQLPFANFREVTAPGTPVTNVAALDARDATDVTSVGFTVARTLRGLFTLDVDTLEMYQ